MPTRQQIERYRELLKFQWECNLPYCSGMPHEGYPNKHARSAQLVRDAYITAFITGRGWGKTRSAAQFVAKRMLEDPGHRVNIVAPTFAVGRDVCIEGQSGIVAVLPPDRVLNYNRSLGELELRNGSKLKTFSAYSKDDAEAIRGSQSDTFWGEECAQWRHAMLAWDMAMLANRLGEDPRVVITATPKNTPLVRKLFNDHKVDRRTGHTYENAENLALTFINYLKEKYENTRLGTQELAGLLLEDVVGALWSRDMLRFIPADEFDYESLQRIVVAVDPPGSHRARASAEAGIVVVGKRDEQVFILEDASQVASPEKWSSLAIYMYDKWKADAIIAEANFGGAMVQSTLRASGYGAKVKMVTASRGKQIRAEPVVNLFERKLAAFVGDESQYDDLTKQLCTWVPPGQTESDEDGVEVPIEPSNYSPDRLDAMVHGITEIALQPRNQQVLMTCRKPRRVRSY